MYENKFVLIGLGTTDFLGSLKDFLFLIVEKFLMIKIV